MRIAPQRTRQIAARAGERVALRLTPIEIPLPVHVHREDFVTRLRIDAQRFAHVRMGCHRIRGGDRFDAGIELPLACAARRHRSGDPRFEPSDDQSAIAQQLEEISLIADA